MKSLVLADSISASAVAAQTGVQCRATPFLNGRQVVGRIMLGAGVTGAPVIKIQGSDDAAFTTPVDLLTLNGVLSDKVGTITCMNYMRANVTTGAGAGGLVTVDLTNGS